MLFHVPIEPYETRYTADWIKQFEDEFRNHNIKYETILGEQQCTALKEGTVLDACGTNIYKFSQLIKLLKKINDGQIKDGDCIFFADMWFPGLESLFYVRNLTKIKFKIYGILHAGTWDKHDFTAINGMGRWAQNIETSWIKEVDQVFVATQFHKDLICNYIKDCNDKITVTGIPFYGKDLQNKYLAEKEPIIVFPHRKAIEKNPDLFDKLSQDERLKQFKFIKTLDVCKNRQEYFDLLGKAMIMVSFAEQETFGYSTVESMALNCRVVVPNALSYVETVPEEDRYNVDNKDEWVENVVKLIQKHLGKPVSYLLALEKWEKSIDNMINYMEGNK